MIPLTTFAGKRVAVFGLGSSGLVAAHALAAGGADVDCWDDRDDRTARARADGLATTDLRAVPFAQFDALVLAPGVPLTHPAPNWTVRKARAAGIEIIGDIELFDRERRARFPACRLVAITGTNGKSTTTALIGHLLEQAGEAVAVGGNIGRPVLDLDVAPSGIAVVECSSFQIDLAPRLRPTVGVHLNLSPDHLDRHGDMDLYAAIKERLVAASEAVVIGVDDARSAAIAARLEAAGKPVLRISAAGPVPAGVSAADGIVRLHRPQGTTELADLAGITTLRGRHNAQNAAAAMAAVVALGLDPHAAAAGLASFPGLPHRLEQVGQIGDAIFVNDSKATNAESARQALSSFEEIYWIAGGVPKAGGITSLADLFGRIRKAYLIGEAAEAFAETLAGRADTVMAGTLEAAVAAAAADTAADTASRAGRPDRPRPVVLLSPACASFDQFTSYAARGDAFRSLVDRLTTDQMRSA